jgi:transcriptional regulator of heat shock response
MNTRQKQVLSAIVELYTKTALPVGSQALLEHFEFPVSSATLRNDMALLEEEGYLYQPHVSAGRIPTDEGYRLYVEEMMGDEDLSREDQRKLQKELLVMKAKQTRMGRSTAKLLSALSGNLVVSGLIGRDELYDFGMKELMEKPEFQEIDELCRIVETLDSLDEKLDSIMSRLKSGDVQIFIGEENPIKEISNCSMVVAPYENSEGKGILAIIGPKRMDYAKNKSLIEYMKKLLNASLVIVLFVTFF